MAAAGSLGTAIRARLDELGLPARRFTAAGYISAATLSRVFAGQDTLRDPARAAELERGLGWRAGSINAVRAGRSATAIAINGWPSADGDWRSAVEAAWAVADAPVAAYGTGAEDVVPPDLLPGLLDFLFATVRPADADELATEEVARRVSDGGGALTAADLEALRSGERRDLGRQDAQALAGAFGVPTSYFFDRVDADRVRDQLLLVAALRESGVEQLAYRLAGLTGDDRRTAEAVIESLRVAQQRKQDGDSNGAL